MKQLQSFHVQLKFILFFAVLGLVSLQIPLAAVMGSKTSFTVFDLLAPTVAAFTGSLPGLAAVVIVQAINTLFHGGYVDMAAFIRPFPTLFAVLYFSRKGKMLSIVSILAMIAFIANPVGRQVWYYALFWTIPVFMSFVKERYLLARSLGATFTAHAVGGAIWIWTFHLPVTFWQTLIPVVIRERLLFAIGISITYLVLTNLLSLLQRKTHIVLPFFIEKRYVLPVSK